jgi:hypothetical protein
MPKKLRPAVDLMAFKCRTLKVNSNGDKFNSKFLQKLLKGKRFFENLRPLYQMEVREIRWGECVVKPSRLGGKKKGQAFVNKVMSFPVPSKAKDFFYEQLMTTINFLRRTLLQGST